MSEELKPCPFCGGKATLEDYPLLTFNFNGEPRMDHLAVYCRACKINGQYTTKERSINEIIDHWNTREAV